MAPVNTQRNTVIVGNPGTPPATGYSYSTANPATNPVDLIGAGQNTTTLTFSGGASSTVLTLFGDGSSVSNLRVVVPAAAGGTGIFLPGATASGVLVTSPGPQTTGLTGVVLGQGSTPAAPTPALTQSTISFPVSGSGSQTLIVAQLGALVSDDSLAGQNATAVVFDQASAGYPNSSTLRRVTISDSQAGSGTALGFVVSGQTVSADNVAASLPGSGSGSDIGAVVQPGASADATLNLNHASIYGDADTAGTTNSLGVIDSSSSAHAATTNVRNSIIRNFFFGTERTASAAGAVANVRYDYSDYDVIHKLDTNSSGGTGAITRGVGDLDNVDPGWPNPVAGNFTLPAGSPVINAGDPAPLSPATESTTDVLGKPRISGGRRDVGAVEFQFPPPTLASKATFSAKNGKVTLPVTCNEPASDACTFNVTLKGTVNKVTHKHGHKHHQHVQVFVALTGTVAGGSSATLTGTLSHSALRAIGKAKQLSFTVTGKATDHGGTVFLLGGHLTLARAKAKRHH